MRYYQHNTLLHFLASLLLVWLLAGCDLNFLPTDTGGDRELPPQTRIIDVLVEPDTVAPGDTASFTCIIEDSLDERFRFSWLIDSGEVFGAEFIGGDYSAYRSETNQIKWIAPDSSGYYRFGVFANNGTKDSVSVQDGFVIVVE
jgi:hypothetical protein